MDSDESNDNVGGNSRAPSPCARSADKAFDVISARSNPSRRHTPDVVSIYLLFVAVLWTVVFIGVAWFGALAVRI